MPNHAPAGAGALAFGYTDLLQASPLVPHSARWTWVSAAPTSCSIDVLIQHVCDLPPLLVDTIPGFGSLRLNAARTVEVDDRRDARDCVS